MNFFSVDCILFTLWGYPVGSVELTGTLSGFFCVLYCAKGAVIAWPLGIINSVFFFILFYQTRLYPDMFLQIYYFVTSVYGWWRWKNPKTVYETDSRNELKVSDMNSASLIALSVTILAGTSVTGFFMSDIHNIFPAIFPEPSSFPYADSFVAILSITAQVLLSLKKRENWILWIVTDATAAVIYFMKGIYLVGIEYIIFGVIASAGLWNWNRILFNYTTEEM